MSTFHHRTRACTWLFSGAVLVTLTSVGTGWAQQGPAGATESQEPSTPNRAGSPVILGPPLPLPKVAPAETTPQTSNEPLPAPFQLTAEQQQRLGQLLDYWEQEGKKVKTFRCRFELLRYDTVFGPADFPKTKSEGSIRYAAPDKGVFRVEKIGEYSAPSKPGAEPTYAMRDVETAEHWVCDGDSIYEFDSKQKQLVQRKLPPGLRGKEIVDGPLPFIFGATRTKIESRYWIRECLPQGVQGEYWFEAFPKRREEAGNFQKVMVILEAKTFLPRALQIFPPTYDARKNRSREVFVFSDRHVNQMQDRSLNFMNQFISPKVPFGWKRVVQSFEPEIAGPTAPQAAERPHPGVNR